MVDEKKLHIAIFPWLAFGHIIPYLELAKQISQRGHKISFISTPRNIDRLPQNLTPLMELIPLPFPHPHEHYNLPPHAEATTDVTNHQIQYLKKAFDDLQKPMSDFLESSTPDWIIHDFAPYRLPPITSGLGISRATFSILAASSSVFFGSTPSAMINGEDYRTEPEHFTVPPKWIPFPSNVAFRYHEAKRFLGHHFEKNVSGVTDMFRFGKVLAGCDVVASRSCRELDADYLILLEELYSQPVVPIGLLPPPPPSSVEFTGDENWTSIKQWLDKRSKGSVVYIALGSELTLSQDELTQLALGLEQSSLPFFWVMKQHTNSVYSLPDGFEERTQGRGIIWTKWVPQLQILGHESVGGFLTHCGWSSVIEGLSFGLPLIMLPFCIDQGLIARRCQEKNVGLEIPRDEVDGSFSKDSVSESLSLVMTREKMNVYREKAMEAKKIFGEKGIHDGYVDEFVEYLVNKGRT